MKNLFLLLFIAICMNSVSAQNHIEEAKKDLTKLKKDFNAVSEILNAEKGVLQQLTENLDVAASEQLAKTIETKKKLDSIYELQRISKIFYQSKKVNKDSLDLYFAPVDYTLIENMQVAAPASEEKEIFLLYGDDNIIKKSIIEKDSEIGKVFEEIFSINSETCLGTFEIPGHRQKIALYKPKGDTLSGQFVYFEEIKFSIREGSIYDIRVRATDASGKQQFYFENIVPISLLNYNTSKVANLRYLFNTTKNSLDIAQPTAIHENESKLKLLDVLSYFSNPGNNFVPDDVEFSFPKDETDATSQNRRVYKVNQDTNLQNVVELRTYTDFLGLFDDAPNGIVQVEGKADFFVSPFQVKGLFPLTFFKKLSPFVHYSRLDDETRSLTLVSEATEGQEIVKRPLEIIQKSYLEMGTLLDVVSLSFRKDFPFSLNFFYATRYQIATIERENEEDINFKTLGLGGGLRLEFKRFNNFGFNFSPEFTFYNHINRFETLKNPRNFWLLRYDAEVFYYPGASKSQSIFLRLRTFMDTKDGEDSFFQLQFGYRFSLGLGSVKGKG